MLDEKTGRNLHTHVARLMTHVACALFASVMAVQIAAAARSPASAQLPLARFEDHAEAMGSLFAIVLYGPDDDTSRRAAEAAFEEARRLDRLLSNYIQESEWSAVNRDAAARPVRVSDELFDLLDACAVYNRQSEGAFDITVGPLMKVWRFYKGEGALPKPAEVTGALARTGARHVRLDRAKRTVRFDRPGIELDPGGIGKGYAVDRMIGVLKAHGIRAALVSGAGSSVYGLGAPPDEPRGWRMEISAPGSPDTMAADVFLKDMSMSTSGSYEKFFYANGKRYSHLMDPRTGYPAQGVAAVSVVAPRTIDSEAWTKAVFINGQAWTRQHTPREFRVFFCDDRSPKPSCEWLR
jgi:thiamine biosynthesis lipoprotein